MESRQAQANGAAMWRYAAIFGVTARAGQRRSHVEIRNYLDDKWILLKYG
jgi:hypothetical protein